jgi:hypothetical protein
MVPRVAWPWACIISRLANKAIRRKFSSVSGMLEPIGN